MSARKGPDRFRPPASEEKTLELAREPGPSASSTEPAAIGDLPAPAPRQPLRYRRPRASWVTVVVLGFAAVGATALAGRLVRKLSMLASAPTKVAAPAASVVYHPLAQAAA